MSCSDIQKFKKFQKDKSKVKNQIKYIKGLLLPYGSDSKASAHNAGDPGLIPGLGRSPGERNDNPLQYSCLGNTMDGEVWQAI